MTRYVYLLLAIVTSLSFGGPASAQNTESQKPASYPIREWESKAGTKISARLGSLASREQMTLVTEEGKVLTLNCSDLSPDDQKYFRAVWYRANPLRVVQGHESPSLDSVLPFLDSLQVKVDRQALQIRLLDWKQLKSNNTYLESVFSRLEDPGRSENSRICLIDSTWRSLVAGENHENDFSFALKKILARSPYELQVILVDRALSNGNLWGRDRTGIKVIVEDRVKGLEKVDHYLNHNDFGEKVRFLRMRDLQKEVEKTLPEWKLSDSFGLTVLESGALATLMTAVVPPLVEVQQVMIAQRKNANRFPPIPENSFLSLSEAALGRLDQIYQQLLSEN